MTATINIFIEASGGPKLDTGLARKFLEKFCRGASEDDLRQALYLAVQGNLTEQVAYLHDLNVPFDKKYNGIIDLLLLAVCSKNFAMVELLAKYKEIDHAAALEQAQRPGYEQFRRILGVDVNRQFTPNMSRTNKQGKPGKI